MSENTIIELGLNDIPDLELLPKGEYELEIVGKVQLFEGESQKSGDAYKMLKFPLKVTDVELRPNTPTMYHTLSLPTTGDDKDQKTNKLRRLKQFCDACEYDYSTGDIDPTLFS